MKYLSCLLGTDLNENFYTKPENIGENGTDPKIIGIMDRVLMKYVWGVQDE
ncbi:MAG: hypothetical protein FD141_377 [Fusobacteria bacterium]|nr:MAG: hypothetical protein FD141_377 [Fusobacteriota bacterium]KAF0228958.1 MAG: hypothetical protein FD182_1214 [Fusobacteriota bacterium]